MEKCLYYWSSLLLKRGDAPKPLLEWCGHEESKWKRDAVKEIQCHGRLKACLLSVPPAFGKKNEQ